MVTVSRAHAYVRAGLDQAGLGWAVVTSWVMTNIYVGGQVTSMMTISRETSEPEKYNLGVGIGPELTAQTPSASLSAYHTA